MALSEAEIREMLGLKSAEVFAIERMRQHTSPEMVAKLGIAEAHQFMTSGRNTGRTTNAIVKALARASKGEKVFLISGEVFGIERQVKESAERCGIDHTLITVVHPDRTVFDASSMLIFK